jgi:hypothetical protein
MLMRLDFDEPVSKKVSIWMSSSSTATREPLYFVDRPGNII